MADAVLTRDGPVAVPLDYVVPNGGELLPLTVTATIDGTNAASSFYAIVQVISPSGRSMGKYRSDVIAAGGSADVTWFPGAELEETTGQGLTSETLFLDTRNSAGVTSGLALTNGQAYLITATGSWSYIDHALDVGTPDANALYPTPGSRTSTQVGYDPETLYAYYSGSPPGSPIGHVTNFQMNLGGGYVHVEPSDGPHATPVSGHKYSYQVTGQGQRASFIFVDSPGQYADNYGYVYITIDALTETDLPPAGPTNALLRSISGSAVWESQPDISEADLTLSDITTANVSTSRHGLTPKLPNDATKFLDGTGGYTVPPGTGALAVTDGITTVSSVQHIDFTNGATVSSGGAGIADVAITNTPGSEIHYTEITSPIDIVSTTEATGTTILSPGAISFDGTPVLVEFFCLARTQSTASSAMVFSLFEGATQITELTGFITTSTVTAVMTFYAQYRFTPSNASHTYTVTAYVGSTSGTPRVNAGSGGTGGDPPAFIRFTKV